MKKLKFNQLPGIIQISVGISIFMAWHMFELFAINPYFHPYFPGYVVGDPCVWDAGVALAIGGFIYLCRKRHCVQTGFASSC